MVGTATRAGLLTDPLVVVDQEQVDMRQEGCGTSNLLDWRSHVLGAVGKRGWRPFSVTAVGFGF